MVFIYKHKVLEELQAHYGHELDTFTQNNVADHLRLLATSLAKGLQGSLPCCFAEVSNYHPDLLGKADREILNAGELEVIAEKTIAYEYGFSSLNNTPTELEYDQIFELAVQHCIKGEINLLAKLLELNPDLVNQRSTYGHKATLLHYCASNGVEMWRQQVPENLADVVQFLLEAGANIEATMPIYGSESTFLELFQTSAHPIEAGVYDSVMEIF